MCQRSTFSPSSDRLWLVPVHLHPVLAEGYREVANARLLTDAARASLGARYFKPSTSPGDAWELATILHYRPGAILVVAAKSCPIWAAARQQIESPASGSVLLSAWQLRPTTQVGQSSMFHAPGPELAFAVRPIAPGRPPRVIPHYLARSTGEALRFARIAMTAAPPTAV